MIISTFVIYLILFFTAYLTMKFYKKFVNNKKDLKHKLPPCLPSLPIVGSLPFISDPKRFYIYFMKKSKSLGNVIGFYLGNNYHVILNGRKTIHEAFVKKAFVFASRPSFYLNNIYNPNQKGIIEHPYDNEFKTYHRACLNVFKKHGLGQGIMETRIKTEVEYFIQQVKLKKGQPFYPIAEVTITTFNMISSIIYGKRRSIDDPEFLLCKDISRILARDFVLMFFPILRFIPYFKGRVKMFIDAMKKWENFIGINLRSVLRDESVDSFCKQLIEEIKITDCEVPIDEDQLKVTFRDLMFAGTETSASTMLWFIYYLANHQDVQKQMRDELDRVVGSNRLPCTEDKPNLPITEACLYEVMRIRTLAPLAAPHLTLKESVIDGVYIPSGVVVSANLYSVHMDSDVWDEPEKFKIERFLNEDKSKRSCLGEPLARQELFLFASSFVQQFHILPPEGQNEIVVEEQVGTTITPSPFNVRFVERV